AVGQRRGHPRIAFGIAVDVDLLRDHAQHRAVLQCAAAEVPARVDRGGDVVAVGGPGVGAHGLGQAQLAVDVEVQLRIAQLAVDPQSGFAVPAHEGAQGGLRLSEVAAAAAEVDAPAAVAGETAEHQVAAAPVHAAGQRRDHAVVIVAAAVTLEVAAQVGPPAHAVGLRRAGHVRADDVGARAAGGRG